MDQALFNSVDNFIIDRLALRDEALDAALKASDAAGLPPIAVAPNQGKMLSILATMIGARRILEIGTLGGYSTLWLGWALPLGGSILSLEANPAHAEVARANIARAGLSESVEVRVGKALDTLKKLDVENPPPFDMFFIDADKAGIPEYFRYALKLGHKGSLIVVDNVVRGGRILDEKSADADIQGIRRFYEMLAAETRVSSTAIQTVGLKGHDGFALALVVG